MNTTTNNILTNSELHNIVYSELKHLIQNNPNMYKLGETARERWGLDVCKPYPNDYQLGEIIFETFNNF